MSYVAAGHVFSAVFGLVLPLVQTRTQQPFVTLLSCKKLSCSIDG